MKLFKVLFIAAICATSAAVYHPVSAADNPQATATEKLSSLDGKSFDAAFLKNMIQHHQMAIQMSKMAEQQASSPQIKELAAKISAEQSAQIKQMTQWLSQWYGEKPAGMDNTDPAMQKSMADMQKLRATSGPQFDSAFLASMSDHHEQALKMARLAEKKAQHPEVRQLAANILKSQKDEIQQMSRMKAAETSQ